MLCLLATGQRADEQRQTISFTTTLGPTLGRSPAPNDFWDAWCISYWFPWGTSQACYHYPLTLAQRSLIKISVLFQVQAVEDTGNQMTITKFSLQEMVMSLLADVELRPGILGLITNPVSHLLMKIWGVLYFNTQVLNIFSVFLVSIVV